MKKITTSSAIKKIPLKDVDQFISIVVNAYPGFGINSDKERKELRQRIIKVSKDPTINHYGFFR